MSDHLQAYLQVAERMTHQAARMNGAIHQSARRELLKYVVRSTKITSGYICEYLPDQDSIRVVSEYMANQGTIAEANSDLGEIYLVDSLGETFIAWLKANDGSVYTIYLDDLPMDHPERPELEKYGGKSVTHVPIRTEKGMWGFIEMWDSRDRHIYSQEEIEFIKQIAQYIIQVSK